MADEQRKYSLEFGEAVLRELVTDTLTELLNLSTTLPREKLGELLMDYGYSTRARGIALETEVLIVLRAFLYSRGNEGDDLIEERVVKTIDAITRQQRLRASLAQPPRMVTVEIHSALIEDLRAEAEEMELNTLGQVPGPVVAVLEVLEAAAEARATDGDLESGTESREDSIAGAIAEERGRDESAALKLGRRIVEALPRVGAETEGFGDEEKIPVLEGMAVRSRNDLDDDGGFSFSIPAGFLWVVERVQGDSIELGGRTIPGVGLNMERKDFWKAFSFASDVVQPGAVLAEIRRLALEERSERNAELRSEIGSTISQGVGKVTEGAARLSERYGPVGERFFKRAVSAAKNAVETVGSKIEEVAVKDSEVGSENAEADSSKTTEAQVLDEAFSGEGFADSEDHEVDLQALREKLASTPKAPSSTTGSRGDWSRSRDQLAQLIYDAQHPDRGSKWLTTVDGSPNVASYEAADAVLAHFAALFASSGDGAESGAENSSEHSTADEQNGLQSPVTDHGSEEEDSDSKIEDFPLPVPPAESDLGRLRYLQRALDLDDFESSFRRDDTLTELLELLPNALEEIRYLRDNEGEVQKSFLETLEGIRGAVNTSSVRHAWNAYEDARKSRDLIYQSRQEERTKVRRLEGEIEELKAASSSEIPTEPGIEDLKVLLDVVYESYDIFGDEPGDLQREALQGAIHILNRPQREEAERLKHEKALARGYDDEFSDDQGYRWLVNLETDSESGRRLLTVRPEDGYGPSFSTEIEETGFLSADRVRELMEDSARRMEEVEASRRNSAAVISYRPTGSQRELGHVETLLLSGVLMDVKLRDQEGTTLKLLELTPKDADEPLFRREICAAGFLSEEKLRKIIQDPEGWIGNDAVGAASQNGSSSTFGDSPKDENEDDGSER